jgi:hypothetical protein
VTKKPTVDPSRSAERLAVMTLAAAGHFLEERDLRTHRTPLSQQIKEIDAATGITAFTQSLLGIHQNNALKRDKWQQAIYERAVDVLHCSVTQGARLEGTAIATVLAARAAMGTTLTSALLRTGRKMMAGSDSLNLDPVHGVSRGAYMEALAETLKMAGKVDLEDIKVRQGAVALSREAESFDGIHRVAIQAIDGGDPKFLLAGMDTVIEAIVDSADRSATYDLV